MKKGKLVWISPHLPYDNVNHAGGKTQNYYLNKLIDSKLFDIRLIGFYKPEELEKFTLNKKIQCNIFCYYNSGVKKILRNFIDLNYLKNPWNRYANITTKYIEICIINTLKKYKSEGYEPDVIVLHWTETVLFVDKVKSIFSDAKIVAIEEDVALLSFERRISLATSDKEKRIAKIKFTNIEKAEIEALNKCDLIICNNQKDVKILEKYQVSPQIKVWSVFFEKLDDVQRRTNKNRDILFYGAMSRDENYLSAIWLLDNVRPLIDRSKFRFVILGGNPPENLKQYASDDVVITGFVDDIKPYFENSLCLAAPLVLGAGIKVKILEAMSAGVPVLTNDIGIEGIPAIAGQEFLHCKRPEEYVNKIELLLENQKIAKTIGESAKMMIEASFNYEQNAIELNEWLTNLCL